MTFDTIKSTIDRKIDNFIKVDKLSFTEIIPKLETTRNNFDRLLKADVNSSARLHMMTVYMEFSNKRIADLKFAINDLSNNYFFAGVSDIDLFKLIKLRDKISQDVLELETY